MTGFACLWLWILGAGAGLDEARLAECLSKLEVREASEVADCLGELRAEPDASLQLALPQWEQLGLLSRRRLAAILAELGSAELCLSASAVATDADAEVRRAWLGFLSRRDHSGRALEARVAALSFLARNDQDAELRLEALRSLAEVGRAFGALELESRLAGGTQEERRLAAALFGGMPSARERVLTLVQTAFAKPASSTLDSEVLALLLPAYGRGLAETKGAGGTRRERAPFVQGYKHPAPHIRRGARGAFESWITRLRTLGDASRALRSLAELADDGFDAAVVLDERIRIALSWGNQPQEAVRAARELQRVAQPLRTAQDRGLLARALYLEGLALAAAGEDEAAPLALKRAGELLDQLLRDRSDLAAKDFGGTHGEALGMRAMASLTQAMLRLDAGAKPEDADVTELLRLVHRTSLELQVTDLLAGRGARDSLDSILGGGLSPLTLLFARTDGQGWSASRCLKAQRLVGEALSLVAPRELPGFQVAGEAQGALEDPERFDLFVGIHRALVRSIDEWIEELRETPGDPLARARILQLRQRKIALFRELRQAEQDGDWRLFLDHRSPCSLALWQVRDLRAEGRATESRELAEATRAALEETGQSQDNSILAAEIEMAIGTSWSDDDEPERAERELTKALERLEALQRTQEERGGALRTIESIRRMRSEALVSLAVNANVKLRDIPRALEYFERAYELRQDEFMRVLLACYRARSGRAAEARAALEQVVPAPSLYYNLACTWALLGEHELALDYLRRELEENHVSPESRNRQKEWAGTDPDLENLRGEPRFRALIEKE